MPPSTRRTATPGSGSASTKRQYESGATRRAQIVAATIAIIAERGLHGWKTAEVARQVGISEPTLFRHFKSKRSILAAAVRAQTTMGTQMVESYEGEGDAWNRAEGLVITVLSFLESTGGGPLAILLTGQLSAATASTRKEVLKVLNVFRERLTALFRVAVEELDGGDTISPEDLADLAIAIVQSSALRWIMTDRDYPASERARAMLRVAHRALGAEGRRPA